MNEFYERTARMLGKEAVERLQNARIALFGLGGVGGHAAEALARAGVGHLTALQVLLSRNADATKKNHMGNTPAELAQQNEAHLYAHRFLTVLDAGKRPDATAYKKEVADRCLELFSKAGGAE